MTERVFADTNLFLRYLTDDVPAQADAVEALLRNAAQGNVTLVVNSHVVSEIVWALTSFYQQPKTDVQAKVLALLNTPGIDVVDSDTVLQAITWWTEHNVDFIDAYNGAWLLANGLTSICTFDQKHFSRLPGLRVVTPGATPRQQTDSNDS